jgi:hypothetical protein
MSSVRNGAARESTLGSEAPLQIRLGREPIRRMLVKAVGKRCTRLPRGATLGRTRALLRGFAMLARIIVCAAVGLSMQGAGAGVTNAIWSPAGTLNVPRHLHSSTLLLDGRVLVAGGVFDCCGNVVLANTEIFDPKTSSWTTATSMNVARAGHLATRLLDGTVLVVDGTPSAEIYDPRTGSWTLVDGPSAATFGFNLIALSSGKVLLAGGAAAGARSLAVAELFDPVTAKWQPTGSMVEARTRAAAALMSNGKVLVAAGLMLTLDIENPIQLQSAEIYDPASGQWQKTTPPNRRYLSPAALALGNGRVLLLGDVGDTEYYDPATAKWTISGTRAEPRQSYSAAVLPTGQVLAVGGFEGRIPAFLAAATLYVPTSGEWIPIASMIAARTGHTATTLANGDVLVAGGFGEVGGKQMHIAAAEVLHLSTTGAIGAGYTGAWYDPAQSGHGLFIEVLPDNRMLAAWFTFTPNGEQAWLYGVGNYTGNVAKIDAVDQPTGGRFIPNFDPAKIVHNAWGSLTVTFSDCNHGTVDFVSSAGYGAGGMSITRLTQPAGLTCP